MTLKIRPIAFVALLALAVSSFPVGRTFAESVDPSAFQLSEDVAAQFEAELRANPEDAFQIFQIFLINHPRSAAAITARFMVGREDLAPSIGAAAIVALSGSWATTQEISDQVKAIAQYLGDVSPDTAVETFATMHSAAPHLSEQILAGVVAGVPGLEPELMLIASGEPLTTASTILDLSETTETLENQAIIESESESTLTLEETTQAISESQVVTCLSEPCS